MSDLRRISFYLSVYSSLSCCAKQSKRQASRGVEHPASVPPVSRTMYGARRESSSSASGVGGGGGHSASKVGGDLNQKEKGEGSKSFLKQTDSQIETRDRTPGRCLRRWEANQRRERGGVLQHDLAVYLRLVCASSICWCYGTVRSRDRSCVDRVSVVHIPGTETITLMMSFGCVSGSMI